MSRKLIVEIIGDDKSVQRAFNRSTQSANKFGVAIAKVERKAAGAQGLLSGRGTAAGFAGAAAAGVTLRFLSQSADAASALEEQVSKSRVVLGAASADVEAFGKTSAEAFGISNRAAVEAASTLAGLFTTIGLGQQKAADLGIELTALSGDLASFFDTSVEESLTALRSGLVGEAEPLRRFNVLLSEARVQQEALSQTGKKTTASLSEQDKVLARIAIIMRETVQAQGDAARTGETLAGKQRELNAKLEDTRARIGALVIPIKTELIDALSDATTAVEALVSALSLLSAIRIPEIKVPIVGEFGGGQAGDLLKKILQGPNITAVKFGVKLVRSFGADEKPEDSIAAIAAASSKALADALAGLEKFNKRASRTGEGFTAFLGAVNKVVGATDAAIAKATAHVKALERLEVAANAAALTVERVSLALAQASATPTLRDDIAAYETIAAALKSQEKAIRAQIALSKDDASLKQDLVNVQSQQIQNENALAAAVAQRAKNQKDAAREAARVAKEQSDAAAAAARSAEQARQFRALGLSAGGDKPIPTIDNLTKQLNQLDTKIAGGKNQRLLNAIRKVLTDPVRKATEETRQVIRDMFETIRGELDKGLEGPLTKGSSFNLSKFLEGIDVSPDVARQLTERLTRFSTAGLGAIPVAPTSGSTATGQPIIIHNVVELDRQVVGRSIKRFLQNDRRHNPPSRR